MQEKIGILQRALRSRHSFLLDRIITVQAQTRCVDETKRDAAKIDQLFDGVARGAANRAHDCAIKAEQTIEQARFAGIGFAVNNDSHAFAKNPALFGGGEQFIHLVANFFQLCEKRIADVRRNVFLGKIDRRFDMRDERDELIAQCADLFSEPPFELFRRRP